MVKAKQDADGLETCPTGIRRLDEITKGGLPRGRSILLCGSAGSGKTSLSTPFAGAACRRGERCLYFAIEESPRQIIRKMGSSGIDLRRWEIKAPSIY